MSEVLLTVVLPVYNAEKYVEEAIDSILNQSFRDFSFVIVDDGSSDSTLDILLSFSKKDRRIKVLHNIYSKGVAGARNTGLDVATTEFIACMDADDFSLPHRFETQINYLTANPSIDICGSYLSVYESGSIWKCYTENDEIKARLLFFSSLYQPTVMMRRTVTSKTDGRYKLNPSEDYDLWARMSLHDDIVFANIPKVLLYYRTHPGLQRLEYNVLKRQNADIVRKMLLDKLNIVPDEHEYFYHSLFANREIANNNKTLDSARRWTERIFNQNSRLRIYKETALKNLLSKLWLELCKRSLTEAPLAPFLYCGAEYLPKNFKSLLQSGIMLYRLFK